LVTNIPALRLLEFLFNPLNTELNPNCHLLALLGAHHILHVGRIRVKPNSFGLLSVTVTADITKRLYSYKYIP